MWSDNYGRGTNNRLPPMNKYSNNWSYSGDSFTWQTKEIENGTTIQSLPFSPSKDRIEWLEQQKKAKNPSILQRGGITENKINNLVDYSLDSIPNFSLR